jgi:RNA polymerase sigma-70 factor (ECF subfamily)
METLADSTIEPDHSLLASASNGDHDAFARLVERHAGRLPQLALRVVANADDADDAVQEALIRAYRALPRFRGESNFSSWLYRITLNVCHDILRARRARQSDERFARAAEEHISDPDSGGDPPSALLASERRAELESLLERIPTTYRQAVELHDREGLTVAAIAELTQVPLPTAKARLRRGRLRLIDLLARQADRAA